MVYPRFFMLFFVGFIALLGAASASLAQSAAKAPGTATQDAGKGAKLIAGGWTLACKSDGAGKNLRCEMSHTVAVARTRQTILSVHVTPIRQADKPDRFVLRFQLPHGLNLPAGVKLQIDGKDAPAPLIRTSSQAGVFANTPFVRHQNIWDM